MALPFPTPFTLTLSPYPLLFPHALCPSPYPFALLHTPFIPLTSLPAPSPWVTYINSQIYIPTHTTGIQASSNYHQTSITWVELQPPSIQPHSRRNYHLDHRSKSQTSTIRHYHHPYLRHRLPQTTTATSTKNHRDLFDHHTYHNNHNHNHNIYDKPPPPPRPPSDNRNTTANLQPPELTSLTTTPSLPWLLSPGVSHFRR